MRRTTAREKGQGVIEYSLLLALMAVIVIVSLVIVGKVAGSALCTVSNGISPGATCANAGGAARLAAFATTEATVAIQEQTFSTAYTDLSTTGPAVTIVVPASGRVRVTLFDSATCLTCVAYMGFALSGATTAAASDAQAIGAMSTSEVHTSRGTFLLTLAAGSTTFAAKYRTTNTYGPQFSNRHLMVEPVDADNSIGGTAAFATTDATIATQEQTFSTTYTDLATAGPAVTVVVPTSGRVRVTLFDNATCVTCVGYMGFALSGATTAAASDAQAIGAMSTSEIHASSGTFLLTLAAGSTTFTAKYRTSNTYGPQFAYRHLMVEPVDADNSSGATAAFATTDATVATQEQTFSTAYTDLSTTGPAVTIVVPASGRVRVTLFDSATCLTCVAYMGFALSGATTAAASDAQAVGAMSTSEIHTSSGTFLLTLAPGSTTFTAKYRTSNTYGPQFSNRHLMVEPVDADKG